MTIWGPSGDGVLNPPEGFPYFTTFIAKPNVCWCHGHVYVMQSMQWCNYWVLHCHNNNPRKANNPSKPFPNPASENLSTSICVTLYYDFRTRTESQTLLSTNSAKAMKWNRKSTSRKAFLLVLFYLFERSC